MVLHMGSEVQPVSNGRIPATVPERPRMVKSGPFSTWATVIIDVIAVSLGALVALLWMENISLAHPSLRALASFVPLTIAALAFRGLYRHTLNRKFLDEAGRVVSTVAFTAMLLLSVLVLSMRAAYPGAAIAKMWGCVTITLLLGRLLRSVLQRAMRRHDRLMCPTLVIGAGPATAYLLARMVGSPEHGMKPVGVLAAEAPNDEATLTVSESVPYLGSVDALPEAIRRTGAERLVVAYTRTNETLLTQAVRIAHREGLRVWVAPRMSDVIGSRAFVDHIGGMPLLAIPSSNPRSWKFSAKHLIDRTLAALILLAVSPVFLTIMLLVRLSSPGPIFFSQDRVGRDGQVFGCLKFRSMRPLPADADSFAPTDGSAPGGVEGVDRRTRIGKFIRASSLDELPQLINVLRGDMSLVGPRPERPEYVSLFEAQVRRYGERARVKAGVTGWAQVHGLRGQTSIADRAEWDNYYIDNWSLGLDVKILLLTVAAVLKRAE